MIETSCSLIAEHQFELEVARGMWRLKKGAHQAAGSRAACCFVHFVICHFRCADCAARNGAVESCTIVVVMFEDVVAVGPYRALHCFIADIE